MVTADGYSAPGGRLRTPLDHSGAEAQSPLQFQERDDATTEPSEDKTEPGITEVIQHPFVKLMSLYRVLVLQDDLLD